MNEEGHNSKNMKSDSIGVFDDLETKNKINDEYLENSHKFNESLRVEQK